MFVDTHVHLDAAEFDGDRQAVIVRARAAGVTRFVIPAVSLASCAKVRGLAESLQGSVCAYGIHPLYVGQANEQDIAQLRTLLGQGEAAAVGEIGLDGFVADADPVRQEWFFCEQLKLARDFDLPVLVHIRRAQDRVLKYLRRYRVKGGIAHAFNGSAQQADEFLRLGFALGFGGAMTYSGSQRIRRLAANVPLERIVLESDAPDIPPAWAPISRNEPSNVARFAAVLAQLRDMKIDEIAQITTNAAEAIFSLGNFAE